MSDELIFHDEPIAIDDSWKRDDTYEGVYPSGARVKDAYFSPKTPAHKCIKPNWRYLFKLSRSWCPWQFWCEIIAYRLGHIVGVRVPPAHIGYSKDYKEGVDIYAALIEWFYDDKEKRYISGGQIMVQEIESFDRERGRQHNLKTIRDFFSNNERLLEYWAAVLTFDALIGNTDRHQDNWGLVIGRSEKQSSLSIETSPAFDNGTALCYEIQESNIDKYNDANRLKRYLTCQHAKHHMKWSLDSKEELNFFEFMQKFATTFPKIRPIIKQKLDFAYQQVMEALTPLVGAVIDPKYRLTQKRLDFILKIIFERRRILRETLGL